MKSKSSLKSSRNLTVAAGVFLSLTSALSALPAFAAALTPEQAEGLSFGPAGGYGLVDLGSGTTLGLNSGPISGGTLGGVLVGNNVKVQLSGGNNGGIPNGLYTDGTANISGNLQNSFNTFTVPTSITQLALTEANKVSNYAASLTPTQTYGSINNATTVSGNGGLNVIDVSSIQNAPLSISGNASDVFVFNVSGTYQTNQAMTLSGVNASQILFNFTGTSGNVFQTSGGDTSYGTYLATSGGQFQFSNLNLTGSLINTAGNVQFVSGSKLTYVQPAVPEAEPVVGTLIGVICLAGIRKRMRYQLNSVHRSPISQQL